MADAHAGKILEKVGQGVSLVQRRNDDTQACGFGQVGGFATTAVSVDAVHRFATIHAGSRQRDVSFRVQS